ncbi:FG-GAP repeat domain-containing protein [Longispora albida]|uniref:FG-GAP repeat domain-containing protein n=1 Tax=Longispora albida TaxID=203523 RepID=UPI00039A8F7B|nr:VCBS repeat-containing protein [Longispora albida]
MSAQKPSRTRQNLARLLASAGLASVLAAPGLSSPAAAGDTAPAAASPRDTAMAHARRTGQRAEITDQGDERTTIFANPDGTYTAEQRLTPSRVRRNGTWTPIDLNLRKRTDGTIAPAASTVDVRLAGSTSGTTQSAAAGSAPAPTAFMTLADGDRSLQMSWPGTLPAPVIGGDVATYAEILPGIDLKVRTTATGVAKLFVVKNRDAAARVAAIPLGLQTRNLTVTAGESGSLTASAADGKPVFSSGTSWSWDSSTRTVPGDRSGEAPASIWSPARGAKTTPVGVALTGSTLTLTPEPGLLTAADTVYPVYIDPTWNGNGNMAWTMVNGKSDKTGASYWNGSGSPGSDGLIQIGADDYGNKFRSFIQHDTTWFSGKNVLEANWYITMTHAWSWACDEPSAPYALWLANRIDPGMNWNNSSSTWSSQIEGDTRTHGNNLPGSSASCPNNIRVRFNVTNAAQTSANSGWSSLVFGLRTIESTKDGWRRFGESADGGPYLSVRYNIPPAVPASLAMYPYKPCGSTSDPALLTTPTPVFTAWLSDPDGDGVSAALEFSDLWGNLIYTHASPIVSGAGGGASITWAPIPAGKLAEGVTYTYRARAGDGYVWGGYTGSCALLIDTTPPSAPPIIDVSAFGEIGLPAGTIGEVIFKPNGSTDNARYRYGFDKTALTMSVPARANGEVTVPITLYNTDITTLYVQPEDRAGNKGGEATIASQKIQALTNEDPPPAKTPSDVNGDGRGDITALHANPITGASDVVTWIAKPSGGVYDPVTVWTPGIDPAYAPGKVKHITGDFNGDGRTDTALFRAEPGAYGRITLHNLASNGTFLTTPAAAAWDSGNNGWWLDRMKIGAGDLTGDGKDDIAITYRYDNNGYKVFVLTASSGGTFTIGEWKDNGTAADWNYLTQSLADYNGDGKTDLIHSYDYGNCATKIWLSTSTGTTFNAWSTVIDKPAGYWCMAAVKQATGDVTGDGKTDLIHIYDYGNGRVAAWAFAGGNYASHSIIWDSGTGETTWPNWKPAIINANGTGKAEIFHAYNTSGATDIYQALISPAVPGPETFHLSTPARYLNWNNITIA